MNTYLQEKIENFFFKYPKKILVNLNILIETLVLTENFDFIFSEILKILQK